MRGKEENIYKKEKEKKKRKKKTTLFSFKAYGIQSIQGKSPEKPDKSPLSLWHRSIRFYQTQR
jgi:hypothetical protein